MTEERASWYFHGFDKLESVPAELFECTECGALVSNWVRHSNWHDSRSAE